MAWQALAEGRGGLPVVPLDWFGESEPDLDELVSAPLLGGARPVIYRVTSPPPPGTIRIGSGEPRADSATRFAQQWNTQAQVQEHRRRFSSASGGASATSDMVPIDGATFVHPLPGFSAGDPVRLHSLTQSFVAAQARYTSDFDAEELAQIPGLLTLDLRGIPAPIPGETVESLARALSKLEVLTLPPLEVTEPAVFDLSDSRLTDVTLDPTGLAEIRLPRTIEKLTLDGDVSSEAALRLVTQCGGSELELIAEATLPRVSGIPELRLLQLSELEILDLAQVAADFPHLKALHLWGRPGRLLNASALARLSALHTLRLQDLFGWDATQWPGTDHDAMPALEALLLNSVPGDVARLGKKLIASRPNAWVDIRSPRSPEWLAENIDNPLRQWRANPQIPASAAKKAAALYCDALRSARDIGKSRTSQEHAPSDQPLSELVQDFLESVNALAAKRDFIDAGEREDLLDAVGNFCEAAGATQAELEHAFSLAESLIND